jgi:RNA polymerase sigma-70 factor (ECF subfamily)
VGAREGTGSVDDLVAIYERALPHVYGYLLPRCGSVALAEDIAAETFVAAVHGLERGAAPVPTVPWLIGIARHKLVDHWRRSEREQRSLTPTVGDEAHDPWPEVTRVDAVHAVLARLSAAHRAALVLRYVDGLSVAEVAQCVGRSLHATETLLVRARSALRRIYLEEYGDDG